MVYRRGIDSLHKCCERVHPKLASAIPGYPGGCHDSSARYLAAARAIIRSRSAHHRCYLLCGYQPGGLEHFQSLDGQLVFRAGFCLLRPRLRRVKKKGGDRLAGIIQRCHRYHLFHVSHTHPNPALLGVRRLGRRVCRADMAGQTCPFTAVKIFRLRRVCPHVGAFVIRRHCSQN